MNRRTPPYLARTGHGALIIMVLIVMVFIFVLMFANFGGGGSYTQQIGQTKQQGKALAQDISTRQLSILIAQYRQEQGRLPTAPADLDNDLAFRDPWGGTITFSFEGGAGAGGPTTVIYHSNGPDGIRGTADDITKRDTLPY